MDALPFCHATLKAKKPKDSAYPVELRTVGDHIRARRLDLGLYQKDLAWRLGVSTDTVTNWEKKRSSPNLRAWPGVIEFLGYDPRRTGHTIGEKLRLRREGLGLSWAEAARIMHVDPSTLLKWEREERVPCGNYLKTVRRFLDNEQETNFPNC